MKVLGLLTMILSLSACSDAQVGVDQRNMDSPAGASPAAASEQENSASAFADQASEVEESSGLSLTAAIEVNGETVGECLNAMNADAGAVQGLAQNRSKHGSLTADSILYLNVQGQASIDLSSAELSKIKGICIDSASGAKLSLALNASVDAIYYYGRGQSSTSLNFKESGSVAKLVSNVAENSNLQLTGQSLNCTGLSLAADADASLNCQVSKF